MLRWLSMAGLAGMIGAAFWFFHPLAAIWLALLSALVFRHPSWGVSILFVTLSIDSVEPAWGGIQISFSELHLASAVLAYLARHQDEPLDWRPVFWGIPFLAAVVLSGAVHIEWYKVPPHLARASEWLAACFLALNAFREKGSLPKARWALACAGAFYCLAGFLQFPNVQAARIFSFFTNPNQFAGYLGMLFPFFIMFFYTTPGRKTRPVWGYLALLTLLGMVVSASRAALLGLMISWLILWWLCYSKGVRIFLRDPFPKAGRFVRRSGPALVLHGLIAGLALFVALWLGGFDTLNRRVTDIFKAGSAKGIVYGMTDHRLPYYRLGLEVWQEHWLLGTGPGRWEEAAEAHLSSARDWTVSNRESFEELALIHSHNLYIQLGAVLGLAGLLAFLFWTGRVFRELAPCKTAWPRAGTGLLIAFLIHNLFDVTFPSLGQELGCLIGIALAGCRERENGPHPI